MSLLKVEDINVYYGAIHAIKGISFEVHEDEIVTQRFVQNSKTSSARTALANPLP